MKYSQLFTQIKTNFPTMGSSDTLYYAIDEKMLYQWNGAYSKMDDINQCVQVDTRDDLPKTGIIGVLYFIKNESQYALYIGENGGWNLNTEKWQYRETPPLVIGDADPKIYCLDYEMNQIGVNLYELTPTRIRVFNSTSSYNDIKIKDVYMVHRGNIDNIPQTPSMVPSTNTKYSLQSVLGKTPEQVKSVTVLNLYNYLYTPKGINGYIIINDIESGNNYETLSNKPSINGVELKGDTALSALNIYSKDEINKFLENAKSVVCKNRINFPPIGVTDCIYVALDTLIAYIFDTVSATYVPITSSSSGEECKVIVTTTVAAPTVGEAGKIYYMIDTQKLMYFDTAYKGFVPNNVDYNTLTNKPAINNKELIGNVSLSDINVYSKEEVNRKIGEAATTPDYEILNNKPKINNIELFGNKSLAELGILTQAQIQQLISNARSISVVTALPASPVPLTLYYVGTGSPYHLYLIDDKGTTIDLGTTEISLNEYQEKIDNDLITTSKTIVGAINELRDTENEIFDLMLFGGAVPLAYVQAGRPLDQKVMYSEKGDTIYYTPNGTDLVPIFKFDDMRVIRVNTASNIPSTGENVGKNILYFVEDEQMLYGYNN